VKALVPRHGKLHLQSAQVCDHNTDLVQRGPKQSDCARHMHPTSFPQETTMATKFTLFPKLITELRLEIWRLALPTLLSRGNVKLLYPYQEGCWVFDPVRLQQDPNVEDLYIRFDTNRLEPLHVALPFYSVNKEARSVTVRWLQEQRAAYTVSRSSSSAYEVLRPFRLTTDAVFVPTAKLERFVTELVDRPFEADMLGRNFGTSDPALSRLVVMPDGLQALKGDLMETFFQFGGTIGTICVVDSTSIRPEPEDVSEVGILELAEPLARLRWSSTRSEWQGFGDHGEPLMRLERYVEGLSIPADSPRGFEMEVQLVGLR